MSKRKTTNLRLFTNTWPPKRSETQTEANRPSTATLEKPQILDIRFLKKIDMSLVRKEFLNITNLCRSPFDNTKIPINQLRLPRLPSSINELKFNQPEKRLETSESDDPSKSSQEKVGARGSKLFKRKVKKIMSENKSSKMDNLDGDFNNNSLKIAKREHKLPIKNSTSVDRKSTKLPEPCKTCGRADQPERFHSHPVTPLKPAKDLKRTVRIPTKNTVKKPLAIKYKSHQSDMKPSPLMSPIPYQNLVHSPLVNNSEIDGQVHSAPRRGPKGPRSLMCYICGREFGTASLPLHEPKCIEKWERENAALPKSQRRKLPQRPDTPMTAELWNQRAWEICQASLVPCENCDRTFLPERLVVHQRSCKPQENVSKDIPKVIETSAVPRGIQCSICGRMFGQKSIKIHEPQCIRKWELENEILPPDQRQAFPHKFVIREVSKPVEKVEKTSSLSSEKNKPSLFPCYLCGRLFGVSSIYIHEPQCLKKWKTENDKLPPLKRQAVPVKPDIKFTPDGKIDINAVSEANWNVHLSQLIPCSNCGRTFNPDRVSIHERSCKV